jgi:nucleotide-binding universal stress UspA family protein
MAEEQAPAFRRVFVLGRDAVLDIDETARRVAAERAQLVLLSFGYPISPAQDAIVRTAVGLADELRLWLDAVLVLSTSELRWLAGNADDVTIVATGSERRRLERSLGVRARKASDARALRTRGEKRRKMVMRGRRKERGSQERPRVPAAVGARSAGIVADEALGEDGRVQGQTPVTVGSESVEALAGKEIPQPVLDTVWTQEEARARKAARLTIYLGSAPGVGKTFAMLDEGQRARARGTDIVVGVVQTYGRPRTTEKLEGLEVIPAKLMTYRGATFEEMDVEALIERRPERALVDELAHTNIPGSRRAKRWEDVLDILAEGIAVITTLNAQHLASLNDVVAKVTGIRQQETVPDWILDLADQVELVDMSPYALQRRMVHGNVYPDPQKAELALQRFFTTENLTALRELALMRVANQVDDELLRRWSKAGAPETRERILVCVSRPDFSEALIRRGARMAQRTRGDLVVAHAGTGDGGLDRDWVDRTRRLVSELGGEFEVLEAEEDPAETLLSFAYQQHVTQIVVGESVRSRWQELMRGSFVNRLISKASNIDIHVIARKER